MTKKQIIIVGGGITGLSAAYYLKKAIKKNDLPYYVTLLEAGTRLGGKIETVHKNGFTIEKGPDSFLARKPSGMKLVQELGLEDQLIRNETGQAYILLNGALHQIPAGSFMGIPVQEEPFLASSLISEAGKLRTMQEVLQPKGNPVTDQALGAFFRRRFGDELVDHLLEPLLSGIYSGDLDKMSLMATFPNFYHLEQKYGSLLKGLRATLPSEKAGTGKKRGQFVSLHGGLESIIEALEVALGVENYQLNASLASLSQKGNTYELQLQNGKRYEADAVIMATPHDVLPKIFPDHSFLGALEDVPVTSVANVVLGFDQSTLKGQMDGTGFVAARNRHYQMTACTWTNKKWPQTTPEGKVLLRVYVGKPDDQAIVELDDDAICDIVLGELGQVMQLQGEPEFSIVTRWKDAMPQYRVGHLEELERIRETMDRVLPGIFLAGSSYEGVGIPDCIEQGEQAVQSVLEYLTK